MKVLARKLNSKEEIFRGSFDNLKLPTEKIKSMGFCVSMVFVSNHDDETVIMEVQ